MNANIVQRLEFPFPAGSYRHTHNPPVHLWSHAMSRRQFGRAALGSLAVGAAFSTGFWKPGLALGSQSRSSSPVPILGARLCWVESFMCSDQGQ
jgi:hypothetical protein